MPEPFVTLAGIGSVLGGLGSLGSSIFNKPQQQQQYKDPMADFNMLYGGTLSAGNVGLTGAEQRAAAAQGALYGLTAMGAGGSQAMQLGAGNEAVAEQAAAAGLQSGIAGQYAYSNIGLQTKKEESELATELTPVETAKDYAKQYGEAASNLALTGSKSIGDIGEKLVGETGAVARSGVDSLTNLGGQQIAGASQLGVGAQQGTAQLGQQTLASQADVAGKTLTGETSLLQPTATTLAQAGGQALAGQNQLASEIASTNLGIARTQANTQSQLAVQRGDFEGKMAMRRLGAQMAAQGRASFA
jgi:hypothetical protein